MLSIEATREHLMAATHPLTRTETVSTRAALDRILASDLRAPEPVPPADNAAMDGYALRCADLTDTAVLTRIGTVHAGTPFPGVVPAGGCVRIMTGALIPAGCDAVVMQENCDEHEDGGESRIRIKVPPRPGEHIRRAGEDIARGETLLRAGRRLRPSDLGLLASLGLDRVEVIERPRVALLSTGCELREPGTGRPAGTIYDSNRYVLTALLERLGMAMTDLGIVSDEPDELADRMQAAARDHDVLLASGGVSVGDADHTRAGLDRIGRIEAWRVAMKPGKPFTFGTIGDALFLGLPGNPVSTTVTFDQLARPVLRHLAGEKNVDDDWMIPAVSEQALKKKPGRTDFQRGVLECGEDGTPRVRSTGAQGSGLLSSLSAANALIRLPADQGDIEAGETVPVLPFNRWLQ